MISTTSKTLAALVVATVGMAALTPSAFAAGPNGGPMGKGGRDMHHNMRQGPDASPRGGMLSLVCAPKGAERLEKALVGLSYRIDLTDAQQPLYDALKTAALTAQTSFADTCAANMPARPGMAADAAAAPATPAPADTARPNMLERMQMGLKLEEARVAALGDVMPQFEAFFNSLSDDQKAQLEPRGGRHNGDRQHDGRRWNNDHRGGPDGNRGMGRNN